MGENATNNDLDDSEGQVISPPVEKVLPLTKTVTILSDPVAAKRHQQEDCDSEQEGNLQMRWSESSSDDDGDDADIHDDEDSANICVAADNEPSTHKSKY